MISEKGCKLSEHDVSANAKDGHSICTYLINIFPLKLVTLNNLENDLREKRRRTLVLRHVFWGLQ